MNKNKILASRHGQKQTGNGLKCSLESWFSGSLSGGHTNETKKKSKICKNKIQK